MSDPANINLSIDFHGWQISGPDCLSMSIVSPVMYLMKNARTGAGCTHDQHEHWLNDMREFRSERRIRVQYHDHRYADPATKWTQSSFVQPQMMAHDRYFYDEKAGRYTVNRYLDDVTQRYGGIDSVLIWPTYPNLGVDDRNQQDLIRSLPGGVSALRQMVEDFHRRGVRVFFPMMMWDQGTREPEEAWSVAVARLMSEVHADGVNGDTQDGIPLGWFTAAESVGYPLVFEPEAIGHDEQLANNLMSWGYYRFPFVPAVDKWKWLETRHMTHITDRFARDKTDDLQAAFFNGVGWVSWENLWGYWNGVTPRDGEAARRLFELERGLSAFLTSAGWEPYASMLPYGVYASAWPAEAETVYTIVNRNDYDVSGPQMIAKPGYRYFDLYHGVELEPKSMAGQQAVLFDIEAHGLGSILATRGAPAPALLDLMKRMKAMSARPLASFSKEWRPLSQQLIDIPRVKPVEGRQQGMIKVPESDFRFKVQGIEIEGAEVNGADMQYPWEDSPRLFHDHLVHVASFWIDKYPVTNAQFKAFLDATKYKPRDSYNFLRDWKNETIPKGWENKPVTWVSREDAQAYAKWAGKRLPREWEWQYAAQGTDGRQYPWGDSWEIQRMPAVDRGRTMRGPDEVGTHPQGASPFGVEDLVGNVWQWTDEFLDDHSRSAIVRGGSYYQPQYSMWYYPQAYKLSQHGRYLLMSPSMDRSGGIGFRCVVDAT